MKSKVPVSGAIGDETVLLKHAQEALEQFVGAAQESLLTLSLDVNLGILSELMAEEVDGIGPKSNRNDKRSAVRHVHEAGELTLGGHGVGGDRPSAHSADGSEKAALQRYEHFADPDLTTDTNRSTCRSETVLASH